MKKRFGILLSCLALVLVFASCKGETKYNSVETYKTYYSEDFETLNYLVSSKQKDSDFFADMVDGLLETDRFGTLQPCLAESYSTQLDADGNTVWSFDIRKSVEWIDYTGAKVGTVTAQDWVDAAAYILEPRNNAGTTSMWFTFIVGAEDYYTAKTVVENYTSQETAAEYLAELDSDTLKTYADCTALANKSVSEAVGVEAVSEYELEYTVIGQQAYFDSVLTYAPFFPVYGEYLQETGTNFGSTYQDILTCGGYYISEYTVGSYATKLANPYYWDSEHLYIKTIISKYAGDAQTYTTTRELYEAGEIDGFSVSNNDTEGLKKYVTGADGTGTLENPVSDNAYTGTAVGTGTYACLFNFDRTGGDTVAANTKAMLNFSEHTDATYANTQKAILNKNFRKSFTYGIPFETLLETMYTGDGLGLTYQCKGWTIPDLCSADGHDYTYYFAQEFAEKQGLTDVDATYNNLYNTNATEDIIYNTTTAQEYALAAYNELVAENVTFPIYVETFGDNDAEYQAIYEEICAQIETNLTIKVNGSDVKLVEFYVFQPQTQDDVYDCYYYGNYDFSFSSGWGADYSDPLTFLHCWVKNGDMEDSLGLTGSEYENQVLGTVSEMVAAANAITDPDKKKERYEAFAAAEYQMCYEDTIIIPFLQASAKRVTISKVLPYTGLRSSSGLSDSKNKYRVIASSAVTQAQFDALRTAFREDGTNEAMDKVIKQILDGEI